MQGVTQERSQELAAVRNGRAECDRCAASPSRDNAGDRDTLPDELSDEGICMGNDVWESAGEADRAVRLLLIVATALGIPLRSVSGATPVPIIARMRPGELAVRLGSNDGLAAGGATPLSFEELVSSNSIAASITL